MIKKLTFLLLTFTLFSCSKEIDVSTLIDKNSPIELTIIKLNEPIDSSKKHILIQPETSDWKLLEKFAKDNKTGWKSTPASYLGEVYLWQGEFRLITWIDGGSVVINFPDKSEKFHQYTKEIQKGELDFLCN